MTGATQMSCKLLFIETLNDISEYSVFCDYENKRAQLPHYSQHCMSDEFECVITCVSLTLINFKFFSNDRGMQVSFVCADTFLASPTFSSMVYHYEIVQ